MQARLTDPSGAFRCGEDAAPAFYLEGKLRGGGGDDRDRPVHRYQAYRALGGDWRAPVPSRRQGGLRVGGVASAVQPLREAGA